MGEQNVQGGGRRKVRDALPSRGLGRVSQAQPRTATIVDGTDGPPPSSMVRTKS